VNVSEIKLNGLVLKVFLAFIYIFFFTIPAISYNDFSHMANEEVQLSTVDLQELGNVFVVINDFRTGLTTEKELELAATIIDYSRDYEIDPLFILAMIKTESAFDHRARSRKGALGMMQILPATGESIALELGLKWQGEDTLFDPTSNVLIGIHYLSELRGRFSDDMKIATAAYNRGPTDLSMRLRKGRGLKFRYVDRVYSYYNDFKKNVAYN
jgi:soluble lytic murein transglycosylase